MKPMLIAACLFKEPHWDSQALIARLEGELQAFGFTN
ncbi:hypothetical protein J2T41_005343 [Pseudomonas citronellolis]|jgi:hypothetical protein|nr:hypothetical protein [Pseudomonas citronellolis]MCP1645696.1 hypothetical protein [Pseudomonas citronellolis]MCP1656283.1 hypothetical protein [Pseudomonas citronellolis]MCP1668426.1 hypothetical protein [Pseudomonas citronellolis]MCP1699968.1 hypothetical protein [Pseudomonas citronellolis]